MSDQHTAIALRLLNDPLNRNGQLAEVAAETPDLGLDGYGDTDDRPPSWPEDEIRRALLWLAVCEPRKRLASEGSYHLKHQAERLAGGYVSNGWLSCAPAGNAGRKAAPVVVRVIDYSIDDGRPNDTAYRLLTTIVDPAEAAAADLAPAYAQRWEIEAVFDELKTHQRGPRAVLRSKSPELVLQEIWGHLCCHYAIRTLMWEAAERADVDPDRVSFVAALRIARRSIATARDFPPPSGH